MNNIIEELKTKFEKAKKEKITFLLIGQTGVGKSSTINSLIGEKLAPENEFEPQTMSVELYKTKINEINIEAIDTPGLCDDLEVIGNDMSYLNLIKEKVTSFDCLLYVSRLDDTRIRNDEKRAIKLISEAFGANVWEHCIIIFTFSSNITEIDFERVLQNRTELMKSEIRKYSSEIDTNELVTVPVDNKNVKLPNGKEWLGDLYIKTLNKISKEAAGAFFFATYDRINIIGKQKSKSESSQLDNSSSINLNKKQTDELKDGLGKIFSTAMVGAFLGSPAGGPIGFVGGAVLGAATGFLWWLFGDD